MKTIQWIIGTGSLGAALLFGLGSMALYADESFFERNEHNEDREHKERKEHKGGRESNSQRMVSVSNTQSNSLYKEECSSCHLAYPPSLLPQKSWKKIMANLENHFDENAELDSKTNLEISSFLSRYSLGARSGKYSRKMLRNFPVNKTPTRITQLPYFIRKHDEVPKRMVIDNPKVRSFSLCDKCHRGAEKGNFNEHQVKIPGYSGWED